LPKSFERPRPEVGEPGDVLLGRKGGCLVKMNRRHLLLLSGEHCFQTAEMSSFEGINLHRRTPQTLRHPGERDAELAVFKQLAASLGLRLLRQQLIKHKVHKAFERRVTFLTWERNSAPSQLLSTKPAKNSESVPAGSSFCVIACPMTAAIVCCQ
jgi:hypothetical protein